MYFGTGEELGTFFEGHSELLEHANEPVHIDGVAGPALKGDSLELALKTLGVPLDEGSQRALAAALESAQGELDMKKIAAAIRTAYVAEAAMNPGAPLSAVAVSNGMKAYQRQVAAFAQLRSSARKPEAPAEGAPQAQGAVQKEEAKTGKLLSDRARVVFDADDLKLEAALAAANAELAKYFNEHPEQLAKQQFDANSNYMKSVARNLGVKPAEAVKRMMKVREKFTELIKVNKQVIEKAYKFTCKHCGGLNPGCPYKSLPIAEQAMHNADKGWVEIVKTVTEVQKVEQERAGREKAVS